MRIPDHDQIDVATQALNQLAARRDEAGEHGEADALTAVSVYLWTYGFAAPDTHIWIVEAEGEVDNLYVFTNRDDAEAFAATYTYQPIVGEYPINRGKGAAALIQARRDDYTPEPSSPEAIDRANSLEAAYRLIGHTVRDTTDDRTFTVEDVDRKNDYLTVGGDGMWAYLHNVELVP